MTDQPGQAPQPGDDRDQGSGTATEPAPAAPEQSGERQGVPPDGVPQQPGPPPGTPPHAGPPSPPGPSGSGGRTGTGQPGPGDPAGRNALWLAVAGLALTLLASLWGAIAGLVLCAAAVVIGIRARRRARQERTTVAGADVGIAVGAVGLVFALFVAGMSAVLYEEMSSYAQCMKIANTHTDREGCRDQFLRGIEQKFGTPRGQLQRSPLFG